LYRLSFVRSDFLFVIVSLFSLVCCCALVVKIEFFSFLFVSRFLVVILSRYFEVHRRSSPFLLATFLPLFARLFFASEETTFVFVLFPVFLVISALFLARARDPPSNPKVSFWVVFFPLGVSLGKMRHVMMERPRRRALPRAAKKLDPRRE